MFFLEENSVLNKEKKVKQEEEKSNFCPIIIFKYIF